MKNNRKKRNLKKIDEAGCSNEDYKPSEETLKNFKAGIAAKKKTAQERKDRISIMLDKILDKLSRIS